MKIETLTKRLEKEEEKRASQLKQLEKTEERIEQLKKDIATEEFVMFKKMISDKGLTLSEAMAEMKKIPSKQTMESDQELPEVNPNQSTYNQPNQ